MESCYKFIDNSYTDINVIGIYNNRIIEHFSELHENDSVKYNFSLN
jgi:hypothetical protein